MDFHYYPFDVRVIVSSLQIALEIEDDIVKDLVTYIDFLKSISFGNYKNRSG